MRGIRTVKSDLRAMAMDGLLVGVMIGLGEIYFSPFALALGLGEVVSGLLATVPLLAGALLQLATPWGVKKIGSLRAWVILCALIQAVSLLILALFALAGRMPPSLLFLVTALYWGSGMATGPAWVAWVGSLLPRILRPGFLARRSLLTQALVLAGMIGGGLLLHGAQARGLTLKAFALLFLTASLARFWSARVVATQSKGHAEVEDQRDVPPVEFARRFQAGVDGKLLLYMLAVQAAVQVAGPYFTPYLLGRLDMGYGTYTFLISTVFVARVATLPMLGKYARKHGVDSLLRFGGWGMIPVSGLWILSDNIAYLFVLQILSGVVWAAWELAAQLLFFEAIKPEERTSVLTTFNLLNSAAAVLGSILGSGILDRNEASTGAYWVLFGVSSILRGLTVILLRRLKSTA